MSAFDELRKDISACLPAKGNSHAAAAPARSAAPSSPGVPVVMTRAELARALRVSENTITNWVKRGMPCFYVGKLNTCAKGSRPRFVFADCLAWVQRGEF